MRPADITPRVSALSLRSTRGGFERWGPAVSCQPQAWARGQPQAWARAATCVLGVYATFIVDGAEDM